VIIILHGEEFTGHHRKSGLRRGEKMGKVSGTPGGDLTTDFTDPRILGGRGRELRPQRAEIAELEAASELRWGAENVATRGMRRD